MTPRHFSNMDKLPPLDKELSKRIEDAPNLWYAFTAATGLDNIARLFTYIPKEIQEGITKAPEKSQEF